MYIARKVIIEDVRDECSSDHFFCKLCDMPLSAHLDFTANQEYGCCYSCYLQFVEARKQLWKDGWRPDKTDVEEYIYKRKQAILGVGGKNEL